MRTPEPGDRTSGPLAGIVRALTWPLRRLLDPRFRGVAEGTESARADVLERLDAVRAEALVLNHEQTEGRAAQRVEWLRANHETRMALDGVRAQVDAAREIVERAERLLQAHVDTALESWALTSRRLGQLSLRLDDLADATGSPDRRVRPGSPVEEIDQRTAELLGFATGHRGFAAQRGLWFNEPVALRYEPGEVAILSVNERIAEEPYALRATSRLPAGARILDVGATESLLSFSLATLGYAVTAVDPRPYPLAHPNLRVFVGSILDHEAEAYDAVLCVSTIEHIGVGAYGQPASRRRLDLEVMERIRSLTRPGGLLLLTTRYGVSGVDQLERTYDDAGLEELLEGWQVGERLVLQRLSETAWGLASEAGHPARNGSEAVALITAQLPSQPGL